MARVADVKPLACRLWRERKGSVATIFIIALPVLQGHLQMAMQLQQATQG